MAMGHFTNQFDGKTVEERFWNKVDASGDCWRWTGAHDPRGYGQAWDGTKVRGAHRLAHEYLVGAIPKGMTLDHLCKVLDCVNLDHIELVTKAENKRRGAGRHHCTRGHYKGMAQRCAICATEYRPRKTELQRMRRAKHGRPDRGKAMVNGTPVGAGV